MNKTELIARIGDLEWEDFEAKEARAEVPKSSWETVSAFANTSGGWLVFGIKQIGKRFEVQGVTNGEKIEQDFLNVLRGEKFNVPIEVQSHKYNIDGKMVLAFYIAASPKKPVYFNNQRNSFIRRGSADQRASQPEVDAMFRDQLFGVKTLEAAPNTSKDDIHLSTLRQYRDYMKRFNPNTLYNGYEEDVFLEKLRITDQGQLTYGGLLFLGKRDSIESHFADFRIDLLEIPGISYADAEIRYEYRMGELENLWEYYFACIQRLRLKVKVEYTVNVDGFGQEKSPGMKALREALVNLLMHTDYFSPMKPRIRIFTNRIEFLNPGGFPKPLSEVKGKDISLPRNKGIAKLFRVATLAENVGFGLDKIERYWNEYNKEEVVFDVASDYVVVTLPFEKALENGGEKTKNGGENLKSWGENLKSWGETEDIWEENWIRIAHQLEIKISQVQIQILFQIQQNSKVSYKTMSENLGKAPNTIERNVNALKKKSLVQRVGPAKGGEWQIVEQIIE